MKLAPLLHTNSVGKYRCSPFGESQRSVLSAASSPHCMLTPAPAIPAVLQSSIPSSADRRPNLKRDMAGLGPGDRVHVQISTCHDMILTGLLVRGELEDIGHCRYWGEHEKPVSLFPGQVNSGPAGRNDL